MKKPIALILTDTHISDNNIDLVTDIFKQAIECCKQNNISTIFHLGDWFTSRKAQSLAVLKATQNIIEMFIVNEIYCHIFKGNHDAVEADTEESYLDIFLCHNFKVYKKEYLFNFGNLNLYLLPYFKEDGSYMGRLDLFFPLEEGINILLTHIGFQGAVNNDGTKVENELTLDKFKSFDFCYSGHYHDANGPYIGSAYQSNFGENDKKGFHLLLEDGTLQFIQSIFPKFIKHKINLKDEDFEDQVKEVTVRYKNSPDNIRIVFEGEESDLKGINKEKFDALGIDVKFEKSDLKVDLTALKSTKISFDKSSILEVFNEFCELNEIENKEFGLEYLKQA